MIPCSRHAQVRRWTGLAVCDELLKTQQGPAAVCDVDVRMDVRGRLALEHTVRRNSTGGVPRAREASGALFNFGYMALPRYSTVQLTVGCCCRVRKYVQCRAPGQPYLRMLTVLTVDLQVRSGRGPEVEGMSRVPGRPEVR